MNVFRSLSLVLLVACGSSTTEPPKPPPPAPEAPKPPPEDALRATARSTFGALPAEAPSDKNPITDARIELGRHLFYDTRLSMAQDLSCNSCHGLDTYGVDGKPTSTGHEGQLGNRNSPSVYNAAFHISQFWDGRAADVEEQAKGPVLNPVEMAMPSEDVVVERLTAVPAYGPLFAAAFPGEEQPITYDNMARAIGAFERRLVTPAPFDAWLGGDDSALSAEQRAGLEAYMASGCTTCHSGPAFGGQVYMKLGLIRPYETADMGRFEVTKNEADKMVFKAQSLRNVAQTGPWFHDGSITSLEEAIRLMGAHQVGRDLDDATVASIATFLGSLTGTIPQDYIQKPAALE